MAPSPSPPPSPGDDVPVSALSRGRLIDVLTDTVGDLERLELPLTVEGIDGARRLRSSLIGQVRDHVLPRLADADVPAIVVVGGSTGAGKSTLVNSVLGREVSDAGVLRPTTRTPVLVVNPEDTEVLADHPVSEVSLSVVFDVVPAGLALVDASDLDSVHEANRTLAVRLLEATDLWLFVTTAARYGDQTPWSTLEEAARRNTPIAVVLNRVPARILSVVRRDLVTRLEGLGLAESPFFVVPDAGPHEGLLPASSVAELRDWLSLLAGRHRAAGLMRRTDRSLWPGLRSDLNRLADAVDAQDDAGRHLERSRTSDSTRLKLSAKAYTHTAEYDMCIAAYMREKAGLNEKLFLEYELKQTLRYGENPHQSAKFYASTEQSPFSLAFGRQIQGKELSYNNIQDANAALNVLRDSISSSSVSKLLSSFILTSLFFLIFLLLII